MRSKPVATLAQGGFAHQGLVLFCLPRSVLVSSCLRSVLVQNIGVLHVWHAPVTFEQFWITDIVAAAGSPQCFTAESL